MDLAALERLLVRFGQMIVEQPWVQELDINPLLALDARVMLHGKDVDSKSLPRPAIRPFPAQYVSTFEVKGRGPITFRPILPEDEALLVKFHESLSDETVQLRYLQPMLLTQRPRAA